MFGHCQRFVEMAFAKIFLFVVTCLVVRAQANGDSCSIGMKKFSNEMDQQITRMQQHIQLMTPVLKDFMWNTFELEYQVKEMRDRLARLEKFNDPYQYASDTVVPVRKTADRNVPSIFIRPGQASGPIGGQLNSLLTENNNNASENLAFETSS